MSDNSSDSDSSGGWTIISHEGSDIEAVASEHEGSVAPLDLEDASSLLQENDLQDQAVDVQAEVGQADASSVGDQGCSASETLQAVPEEEKENPPEEGSCVGAVSDDSDIVTLEAPKVEEIVSPEELAHEEEEEEEVNVSEDFNMGSSSSSQYIFCPPEIDQKEGVASSTAMFIDQRARPKGRPCRLQKDVLPDAMVAETFQPDIEAEGLSGEAAAAGPAPILLDQEAPLPQGQTVPPVLSPDPRNDELRQIFIHILQTQQQAVQLQIDLARDARRVQPQNLQTVDRRNLPVQQAGESIMSYLRRFDSICTQLQIPREIWATLLASQARNELAIFMGTVRLPIGWAELLRLIRERFALTPQTFRQQARRITWNGKETFHELAFRIHDSFGLWFESEGLPMNEQYRDLVEVEHFCQNIPVDIARRVMRMQFQSLREISLQANKEFNLLQHLQLGREGMNHPAWNVRQPPPQQRDTRPGGAREREGETYRTRNPPLACLSCGDWGHLAASCRKNPRVMFFHSAGRGVAPPLEERSELEDCRPGASPTLEGQPLLPSRPILSTSGKKQEGGSQPSFPVAHVHMLLTRSLQKNGSLPAELEGQKDIKLIDPRSLVSEEQAKWMQQDREKKMVVFDSDGSPQHVIAMVETGAEITSVHRSLIRPEQVLREVRMAVQRYSSQEAQINMCELAQVDLQFGKFRGSMTVLVHDFPADLACIAGCDLLYLAKQAEMEEPCHEKLINTCKDLGT